MKEPFHLLVIAGDADGNLGDRAILFGLCRLIRESRPDARITVVSADPGRMARDLGVEAIPKGPGGLPAQLRAMAKADLVLCGGGGLFQDDDSLVKMPYWALRVLAARLLAGRVVGFALGVGPLEARSSRLAARLAFACMERVSVRDREALAVAQPLSRKPVDLVPDTALLLEPAPPAAVEAWLRGQGVPLDGRPLVGVAVRRWFPPRRRLVPNQISARFVKPKEADAPEAARLPRLIARALDAAAARRPFHALFLPTYLLPHEADDRVAEAALAEMRVATGQILRLGDPALYKGVAGRLDLLVGGRMHPTILAAGMGTPVIGLAYNMKFKGFFDLIGQGERLFDVAGFARGGQEEALAERIVAALDGTAGNAPDTGALDGRIRGFARDVLGRAA
ncbi:MAG: polysaccharide pyruvyl transferase family protein [Geminicoccaceae bacterium]|nr:polysaccharide pyruvyl transferase family protein [Geminicoccaceae bacterium]